MGHPIVENTTPFAFEQLFVANEEGQPLLVLISKATYQIEDSRLQLCEEQAEIRFEGVCRGDPSEASYSYEPEVAWEKLGTDVVLIGHAYAPTANTSVMDVGFRVGPVRRIARVFGDRVWFEVMGRPSYTDPQVFEKIPLTYERAFGGVDATGSDAEHTYLEERNPVGRGYHHKKGSFVEQGLLPNIEDPSALIRSYHDRPAPVGFGFVSPNWQPRAQYAGTYDKQWTKNREPLLPSDFDRRFFSAAPPELLVRGYLQGNEGVQLQNVSKRPQTGFALPGQSPPNYCVRIRGLADSQLVGKLDTVIINTDDDLVQLVWRASMVVLAGAHYVQSIEVSA